MRLSPCLHNTPHVLSVVLENNCVDHCKHGKKSSGEVSRYCSLGLLHHYSNDLLETVSVKFGDVRLILLLSQTMTKMADS